MNLSDMGNLASIIAVPVAIIIAIFAGKHAIGKYKKIIRKDSSIKIGDNNKISDSFNKKS